MHIQIQIDDALADDIDARAVHKLGSMASKRARVKFVELLDIFGIADIEVVVDNGSFTHSGPWNYPYEGSWTQPTRRSVMLNLFSAPRNKTTEEKLAEAEKTIQTLQDTIAKYQRT